MRNETASRLPTLSPAFYNDFHCIADDCSMTCCQEWIIHVDDLTLHRWQHTELSGQQLSSTVEKDPDGTHRIHLQEDHLCPWLNSEGLCRLVLNFGDEMLSQTCASFPRQVRRYEDRLERNLLTGCPEVLDRILESGAYSMTWDLSSGSDDVTVRNVGEPDYGSGRQSSFVDEDDRLTLHALRLAREGVCRLLADDTRSIESSLALAFHILTELWEHEPEEDVIEELLHAMTVPEKLTHLCHRLAILPHPACSPENLTENNELFLDLCENYMQEGRYESVLGPLYHRAHRFEKTGYPCGIDPFPVELHQLLRQILIADCRAALLSEHPNLDDMILNFQWVSLRYAAIRQGLFLMSERMMSAENGGIASGRMTSDKIASGNWPNIRRLICVIERMTGCCEEDSHAYLAELFPGGRFDLAYLRFLLGV